MLLDKPFVKLAQPAGLDFAGEMLGNMPASRFAKLLAQRHISEQHPDRLGQRVRVPRRDQESMPAFDKGFWNTVEP